jgi:hypothetical protein
MSRSQSVASVRSRRSLPVQIFASRTSVDGPPGELYDLPEGTEVMISNNENATEVDVSITGPIMNSTNFKYPIFSRWLNALPNLRSNWRA